jgi:hypothetical protein
LGAATGRRRAVASITEPLRIDGSRLAARFGFSPGPLREAIRESGRRFVEARLG